MTVTSAAITLYWKKYHQPVRNLFSLPGLFFFSLLLYLVFFLFIYLFLNLVLYPGSQLVLSVGHVFEKMTIFRYTCSPVMHRQKLQSMLGMCLYQQKSDETPSQQSVSSYWTRLLVAFCTVLKILNRIL